MADYLSPTPYANPLTGLSNDMIQGLLGYMKDKQRTQQMQGLAGLLESTGIPQTVERAAYAQSPKALLDTLTNVNRANVPLLKAETADALMNIAPMVGPAARGAERAAMAAGRAGERYAEKVVPQIMEQGGLPAQLLGDLSQGSIRPMDVWHGSPHGPFTKFDPTKIGSGEGAQAFSYGHYLGEARGTGEEYARQLAGKGLSPAGEQAFAVLQSDVHPLIKQKALSNLPKEAIEEAKNAKSYLYKVDLPDEAIANMLDWDKPLSKQPKNVQDYFYNHPKVIEHINAVNAERVRLNEQYPGRLKNPALKNIVDKEATADTLKGSKLYELATSGYSIADEPLAVEQLRQAGIPGTRYLDEGSRAAGEGTSNFVVYPGGEDLLTIKEINDKPVGGLLGQSKAASKIDEPMRTFKTSDGFTLYETKDGKIVDSLDPDAVDMSWDSYAQLKDDFGDDVYQIGDQLGERKAMVSSFGTPNPSGLMDEFSAFMETPTPDVLYQQALNKQNATPNNVVPLKKKKNLLD